MDGTNMEVEPILAAMDGGAGLPRRNGELVFSAPWESRAFGIAVALQERNLYDWDTFRSRLITEIAAAPPDDGMAYYHCWLAALEHLLAERKMVTLEEIMGRKRDLEAGDHHFHYYDVDG